MERIMKDSGIEWIGKIPDEWELRKIKNLFNIYTGNSIPDSEKDNYNDSEDAMPYIPTKEIDTSSSKINYENGMYVKKENGTFKVAPMGSVLMCIEGGSAGKKIAYVERDVCFVNKLCCFNPKGIDSRYAYYYLKSASFNAEFNLHITGLIGGVSQSEIREFSVVFPSIMEQRKIANFLDETINEIDAIITKTKESNEEYRQYKRAVITESVTKGLDNAVLMKKSEVEHIGDIPIHWEVKKIKYVLSESGERTKTGKEEPLSMSQKWGLIPTREMDVIPNMASSFDNCKIVHVNDLVFNKLKAHLGVFAKSEYDGLVSPDYAVYQAKNDDNMLFLEYVFKTPQYISQFIKYSKGVAQGLTRLYTEELFSIYVAMPPKEEQDEITRVVFEKCTEIDALIAKKEAFVEEIESYKKSLIYEYVTGKKEVK